jgi:hypothetical protein
MGEEDGEQARTEVNGHAVPMPDIRVAHAEEVKPDPLGDIDRSTGMSLSLPVLLALMLLGIAEYRVRTLYPYDGQRAEDLCVSSSQLSDLLLTRFAAFVENLVITAYTSKSGGDWWHGTIISNGKSGFFPKTYVQTIEAGK